MDSSIVSVLDEGRTVAGYATTARCESVFESSASPYLTLMEAIDSMETGDMLVIETGPECASAIFGGLLATAVRARGGVGCVVDGPVRDVRELAKLGFPTFASSRNPLDSQGRDEVVERDAPIVCGGITVSPGDLIVADQDGVVAIPRAREVEVVELALAKVASEGDMRRDLQEGMTVMAAFVKYGIL
jgi:4-hydroxy-4-methyl-2-oxoglutarate aldolase